jgi:hypothetical protein
MNYRTLIIGGYGTIGSSLLKLGLNELAQFESIIAIDKDFTGKPTDVTNSRISFLTGDIEDQNFLIALCKNVTPPALLLNVATATDTVEMRRTISGFDIAYLDSCASSLPDKTEVRFSRYMPYTFTQISSRKPHWLCWGINPGLVEIMSRKMIRELENSGTFKVSIFENDQLYADWDEDAVAVGWSPDMLVEETMMSPTLQIVNGISIEREEPGTEKVTAFWEDTPVSSRIVGHEDIWNIGRLDFVKTAQFIYGLHPEVMHVLDGDPDVALRQLKVPDESVHITGNERVAVIIDRLDTEEKRSMVWEVDHEAVWKKYGVNAVQYQTGKSLLLAILLLQNTYYGRLPITACASDLPVQSKDWDFIEGFMKDLGICWKDAGALNLHTSDVIEACDLLP